MMIEILCALLGVLVGLYVGSLVWYRYERMMVREGKLPFMTERGEVLWAPVAQDCPSGDEDCSCVPEGTVFCYQAPNEQCKNNCPAKPLPEEPIG